MHEAVLDETKLDGTDLADADFPGAVLHRVRLCDATLARTSFYCADLRTCDLEGLSLPQRQLRRRQARRLLPHRHRHAQRRLPRRDLRNTGLADIDWEGADLRDADLTGATFHMGSTRSGLVGSAFACEGSKTGFYTDDYDDRDFKRPEEIRKANLCGADLRGAKREGPRLLPRRPPRRPLHRQQARHFPRCGAILDLTTPQGELQPPSPGTTGRGPG